MLSTIVLISVISLVSSVISREEQQVEDRVPSVFSPLGIQPPYRKKCGGTRYCGPGYKCCDPWSCCPDAQYCCWDFRNPRCCVNPPKDLRERRGPRSLFETS